MQRELQTFFRVYVWQTTLECRSPAFQRAEEPTQTARSGQPQTRPVYREKSRRPSGIVGGETKTVLVGSWRYSTHTPPYAGLGYLHDQKQHKDKRSVTYTPKFPQAKMYEVRLSHCHNLHRTTNTAVTIHHTDGKIPLRIDHKQNPSTSGCFAFAYSVSIPSWPVSKVGGEFRLGEPTART